MGAVKHHLGLLLVVLGLGSCLDDTVEVPEPEPGRPVCMIAGTAYGHFADGTQQLILWPTRSPAGCACVPPSARTEPTADSPYLWSEDVRNELNQLAYEDCERAAAQWSFEWHECRADYESGEWLQVVWYAGADGEHPGYMPGDLQCADDLSSDDW